MARQAGLTRRHALLGGGTALLAAAGLPLMPGPSAQAVVHNATGGSHVGLGADRERLPPRSAPALGPVPRRATQPGLPAALHPPSPRGRPAGLERRVRHPFRAEAVRLGLNTLKLSYFGHRGETDQWAPAWLFSQQRWPGDGEGTYTEAEQVARGWQLFHAAGQMNLLVAPMLEVSPAFRFWQEFPDNLDGLVERAAWLLHNFGNAPNYLRVYDRDGQPRHVVWLIESIHVGPVDPREFAAGFDRAARLLQERLGHRVGWIIDPTPLPAYGSHDGPDPAELRKASSILGISPFNITSQGPGAPKDQSEITEEERLTYARDVMTTWSRSGLPFIGPVLPGYDAHIVFPGSGNYGFSPGWRLRQQQLAVEFATAGLAVDTWNGFTEGYAIPPTEEDGDAHIRWVRSTVAALRRRWDPSPVGAGTRGR